MQRVIDMDEEDWEWLIATLREQSKMYEGLTRELPGMSKLNDHAARTTRVLKSLAALGE